MFKSLKSRLRNNFLKKTDVLRYIDIIAFKNMTTWPGLGESVGWSIIPYTKRIVGSIPSQGTYLDFDRIPSQGVYRRQLVDVPLSH